VKYNLSSAGFASLPFSREKMFGLGGEAELGEENDSINQ